MAGLAWVLGMSSRTVVDTFSEFDISLSHSTVWRDGQDLMGQLKVQEKMSPGCRLKLVQDFIPHVSSQVGVVVAIDLGKGRLKVLGTVNEQNPNEVIAWLEPLAGGDIKVSLVETGFLAYQNSPLLECERSA
jgi:hypothetical protein